MKKLDFIKNFQIHTTDTGSARVQVFLIERRIVLLEKHLTNNKKDQDATKSLLNLILIKKLLLKRIKKFNKVEHDSLLIQLEKAKEYCILK